ncbi:MAG: nicotinate phosphoribosyltransferase [Candidatus Hydrothermarchaeales archaeon]
MKMFHLATVDEIKDGKTTDVYFARAKDILEKKGVEKSVIAEVTASSFPDDYKWGILAGVEEVAYLFEGYPVDVYSLPEGSIFYPNEPVIRIEGDYKRFAELETPLLGLICQASGIATKSARIKKIAGDKIVLSFGIRRMHPAISPMIDRAAYIGGMDGFSGVGAEKLIGKKSSGTMPHALVITLGDQAKAFRYFDEVVEEGVPRIALVDTYYDEKIESIIAAEAVKGLYGVRLDTHSSRRGDMREIAEEVRWELDIRGYKDVKIFVSGGVDEEEIRYLDNVDGFGVGTSISNAKTIDFAMDLVEVEGEPVAKRGKFGGKKEVYRCPSCMKGEIVYKPEGEIKCDSCNGTMESKLKPLIKNGGVHGKLPTVEKIRDYVLEQLGKVEI